MKVRWGNALLILIGVLLLCIACSTGQRRRARLKAAARDSVPIIGQPAPEFVLADLEGETRLSTELRQEKNILLFIIDLDAAGNWNPYCVKQMEEILRGRTDLSDRFDAEIVLISAESRRKTEKFVSLVGEEPPIVLLDERQKTIAQYAAVDPKGKPIPAFFLIDKQGLLRFKYISQDPSDRIPLHHIEEMLTVVTGNAGQVETPVKKPDYTGSICPVSAEKSGCAMCHAQID
jgi:peroxiredoxin